MVFDESKPAEKRPLTSKREWILKSSKTKPGKFYYFNVKTGESTWTRPGGFVEVPGESSSTNAEVPSKRKSDVNVNHELKKVKEDKSENDSHSKWIAPTSARVDKLSKKTKTDTKKEVSQVNQLVNKAGLNRETSHAPKIDNRRKKLKPKRKAKAKALIKGNEEVSNHSSKRVRSISSSTSQSTSTQDVTKASSLTVHTRNPFSECHTNKNGSVAVSSKTCELLNCETVSDSKPLNTSHLPHIKGTVKEKAQKRLHELQASLRKQSRPLKKDSLSGNDSEKNEVSVQDDCFQPTGQRLAERRLSELQSNLNAMQTHHCETAMGSALCDPVVLSTQMVSNNNCPDIEAMEVEYMESEVLFNIEELRQNVDMSSRPVFMDVDMESNIDESDPKTITYIVLDTNILLSHLNFTAELLVRNLAGKGSAHLFIPWQVLHELDHLKDKGKLSIQPLARRAINFLHDKFSSKHPRVRGQKISEATKNATNCADDNILQSCLQLKEQCYDVILVSNDTNLRNKALVSDVNVASKDQLASQIYKAEKDPSLLDLPSHKSHLLNILTEDSQSEKKKSVNSTFPSELQTIIKETFTEIVSKGMEDEYKHFWEKRTLIPPPWEHDQVLHCLSHHWFAICDDFIPSLVREAIQKLRELLKSMAKSNPVNMSDLEECLELTKAVLRGVSKKYNSVTDVAFMKLKVLESKLVGKHDDSFFNKHKSSSLILPQVENDERSHLVFMCFEEAHNAALNICSAEYLMDSHHVQRAKCMREAVEKLVHLLSILLAMPIDALKEENPSVNELISLIIGDSNITPRDLVLFLKNSHFRALIENGITQFTSFKMQLAHLLKGTV